MSTPRNTTAVRPVVAAVIVGSIIGPLTGFFIAWQATPLLGWDSAACIFLAWVWTTIGRLDDKQTAKVATREDPSTAVADLIIIVAGLACLAAVALALIKASNSHGAIKAVLIGIGVLSVALSWASVHTVFTLRYARAYYGTDPPGGIDFNDDGPPDYLDFAYVAFTIGLTFQVSDTNLGTKRIRRLALRHALLAFLFGAVILGLTINVVASLLS